MALRKGRSTFDYTEDSFYLWFFKTCFITQVYDLLIVEITTFTIATFHCARITHTWSNEEQRYIQRNLVNCPHEFEPNT